MNRPNSLHSVRAITTASHIMHLHVPTCLSSLFTSTKILVLWFNVDYASSHSNCPVILSPAPLYSNCSSQQVSFFLTENADWWKYLVFHHCWHLEIIIHAGDPSSLSTRTQLPHHRHIFDGIPLDGGILSASCVHFPPIDAPVSMCLLLRLSLVYFCLP